MVLVMVSLAQAQEPAADPTTGERTVAADFATPTETSVTGAVENTRLISLAIPHPSLAALSFASSAPFARSTAFAVSASSPSSPASAATPSPAEPSAYGFNERDYSLDIALGVDLVRFRSNAFYATAIGPHFSGAFFFKDWLAVEGALNIAFAPTIFANENVRYLGYGVGPKISFGRAKFEPWFHGLVGGIHASPRTSLGGTNGFEITAGGGVDYGLTPRMSLRLEVDYLSSHLFSQWQNSGQGIAAVVFHF
jgi:hypothetical protein